eukprot:3367573-Pyramimonas_sp.AAC.1
MPCRGTLSITADMTECWRVVWRSQTCCRQGDTGMLCSRVTCERVRKSFCSSVVDVLKYAGASFGQGAQVRVLGKGRRWDVA